MGGCGVCTGFGSQCASVTVWTLPVGIAFFSSEAGSQYELIMTAAGLATIPVLVVFAIFQRQIIRGIALTGIKG